MDSTALKKASFLAMALDIDLTQEWPNRYLKSGF